MKKSIAIITMIMVTIVACISSTGQSYCNEYKSKLPNAETVQGVKEIEKYVYDDLEKLYKNIQLASKSVLIEACGTSSDKIKEYIKNIDFYISEAEYILSNIRSDHDRYKDNDDISNGFLAVGMIATNYKFSLIQLKNYLQASKVEDKYKFMKSYFSIINDAERSINDMKLYIPKDLQ